MAVKQITDRKGKPMAFATLEDFTGTTEILVFSDLFEKRRPLVTNGSMVLVRGKASVKEDEVKIIAQEVTALSEVPLDVPTTVHITLSTAGLEEDTVRGLARILGENPGPYPVRFHLETLHGGEITVRSRKYRIAPTSEAMDRVRALIGEEGVRLGRGP